MKRRKFIFLMASVVLFCMTGCIHHNGNIGHWFGKWKLTQITVNEESDTTYNGNIYILVVPVQYHSDAGTGYQSRYMGRRRR